MSFELHSQLKADCINLGTLNNCTLLLHKNALLPWFILVPHTEKTEIYQLQTSQQTQLQKTINQLAKFVDYNFKADKLNIATIGNIVPQLHIHIIARFKTDFCWPEPVWGKANSGDYTDDDLQHIRQLLTDNEIFN